MAVLRFGVYELDPAVPELRRRGQRVHAQEMPLRALAMLLERPGELVPREAFFARLWPHDHSGILDDNLNTAMRKLRLALDDSAHHPRYIETVPRRGYRFVAPVVTMGDGYSSAAGLPPGAEPPGVAADDIPGRGRSRRRGRLLAATTAGLAVVGLAAALLLPSASGPTGSIERDVTNLAVLPFVNASGDPADEYFSDGLSEELMGRLARSKGLRIVSRTSVFALEDADLDAREIGRILSADALVEGSVRRDGDQLRIAVNLIDSSNGYQLWGQVYDRRTDDVFDVQEDIARSIARTLTGMLIGSAESAKLSVPATDPVAYDLYLKGRFYWHRRSEAGLRAAACYFQNAVERAPGYAPAWVGLADAYAVLGFYDHIAPGQAFPRAEKAARRALELSPDNASAHATLGYAALYYDWDLGEAEDHFRKAIELLPGYSKAHQWYANLLTAAGRFDEAEREMRRAQQLDPLSLVASAALGWVRYHAGRHEQALEQLRLTLTLDPDFQLAYLWSGWALEALGRYDEALPMLEQAVERSGGSGISIASLARLRALRGETEEAERLLERLLQSGGYVPSYEVAKAYLALGRRTEGERWLLEALEQRSHSLVFLGVDPQLESFQGTSEFAGLVDRVELAVR